MSWSISALTLYIYCLLLLRYGTKLLSNVGITLRKVQRWCHYVRRTHWRAEEWDYQRMTDTPYTPPRLALPD